MTKRRYWACPNKCEAMKFFKISEKKLDELQFNFHSIGKSALFSWLSKITKKYTKYMKIIVKTFMLKLQENSDIWKIYCIRQPKIEFFYLQIVDFLASNTNNFYLDKFFDHRPLSIIFFFKLHNYLKINLNKIIIARFPGYIAADCKTGSFVFAPWVINEALCSLHMAE
ncbi:hypothetical protein BpHYR1_042837 [Brachionus plicatilis]|uniref:Uncharacterized protein n=1 Tax=Brachionus plicatilis TaxID=10195 RepID=A0A3M7RRM1_BRAPC|nr:hypothetical protein BpHYR1_042837 [Brachionus plicatilis]